jgi:hypothetical protein
MRSEGQIIFPFIPLQNREMDELVSANLTAVVCSQSEAARVRIESQNERIRAMALLRETGGYARYPENIFGVTSAQKSWLSEIRFSWRSWLPPQRKSCVISYAEKGCDSQYGPGLSI